MVKNEVFSYVSNSLRGHLPSLESIDKLLVFTDYAQQLSGRTFERTISMDRAW